MMNMQSFSRANLSRALVGAAALALSGFLTTGASAGPYTLIDENSVVDGDTTTVLAFDWTVDGVDQLFDQSFYYRVGGGPEANVTTLAIAVEGATDTDFDGDDDTYFVGYTGAGFVMEIRLTLDGGAVGSGSSDLAEQVSITNTGNEPLDMHLFQYVDFDLEGVAGGDTAIFSNLNAVRQTKGVQRLTETVITPIPNHREINFFSVIFDSLNDGAATSLSDTPAIGTSFGPGDVTWAFQWDVLIEPGQTFQISKDKNLNAVPEPSSFVLGALGILGLIALGRRRSSAPACGVNL